MPRTHSQDWSDGEPVEGERLQDINQDLDDLYENGDDRLRVVLAASGTPLKYDVGAGGWRVGIAGGAYAGSVDNTVDDDDTTYVEIDDTGALQQNTTAFSADAAPLAVIIAAGGIITSITDMRPAAFGGDLGNNFPAVNVETLSGNKTLDNSSDQIHYFDANGTDRDITLGTTTVLEGRTFYLKNAGTVGDLTIKQSSTELVVLYPGHSAVAQYDGTNWKIMLNITDPRFGDGRDGALNVTSGTTQIDCTGHINGVLIKQYTSFNVSSGATIEFTNVPDEGIVFLVLCQKGGAGYVMAGTVDGIGDGTRGGLVNTASRNGNSGGTTQQAGNAANNGWNSMGQSRGGQGGNNYQNGNIRNVSGGGSGATPYKDGTNAANVENPAGHTATGGSKGVAPTLALISALMGGGFPAISAFPGCGGGSGAIVLSLNNITGGSGTYVRTSAEGGRGGLTMVVVNGGTTFTNTGTYNLGGTSPSNASESNGSYSGTNAGHNMLAAGSGAGSGGGFFAYNRVGVTYTESATYNQNGGTGSTGTGSSGGSGSGTGQGTYGNGANGVAGEHANYWLW